MVGVYNTKRKRMDLYPLEGDAVIGLHLTAVTGSVSSRTVGGAGSSGVSGGLEGLNARERRDMVIADFGSKKKQKMERSRKANIVDIAAVAAAGDIAGALKAGSSKATAAAGADGEGEGSSSSAGAGGIGATSAAKVDAALMRARLATLPPFDDKATQASRAFPLERMIPGDVFRAMARTASALMRAIREADEAEASGRVAPGLRSAAEAAKAREEAEAEGGGAADGGAGAAYVRSVAEVVRQFGRESDFVQDRLTRLLPAIRAEAAAEAAAGAADGGDGAEGEEGGPADGSHAALDSLLADEDAAAAAADKARERKKASRRRRAAAAGDGVPVFRKLVALLYLRALLVLHRCPGELRFKRVPMPPKGGAAAAKSGADAAAASAEGDAAAAAAAAEPVPTKVAVPQLKYLPDAVVAAMLAVFTESRADSRSDAGSLASAAMKSVAAAAAAAAADGDDDAAKAKAAAAAAAAAASAGEPPLPAVVHTRTPALTDKLRAYAAALALTADDFSCDVRLLARDMRIVPARMAVTFRELGCTLKPLRVDDEAAAGGAGAAASAAADAEEVDDEELAAEASESEDEGSDGDGEVKDSRGKKDKAAEAKAKAKAKAAAAKAKAAAAAAAAKGGKARGPIVSYLAFLKVPLVFPALKLGRGK